jgi:cell division protein FtsX
MKIKVSSHRVINIFFTNCIFYFTLLLITNLINFYSINNWAPEITIYTNTSDEKEIKSVMTLLSNKNYNDVHIIDKKIYAKGFSEQAKFHIDDLIESLPTPIVIKNIKDKDIAVIRKLLSGNNLIVAIDADENYIKDSKFISLSLSFIYYMLLFFSFVVFCFNSFGFSNEIVQTRIHEIRVLSILGATNFYSHKFIILILILELFFAFILSILFINSTVLMLKKFLINRIEYFSLFLSEINLFDTQNIYFYLSIIILSFIIGSTLSLRLNKKILAL